MPFYEYECSNCRFYVEVLQKISEQPLKKCPSCGKSALKKLVSAPVFRLKGSGWYETDFKSDQEGKRNLAGAEKDDKESAKPAESESKSDAKAEAKPEAKSDSKPTAESKAATGGTKAATRGGKKAKSKGATTGKSAGSRRATASRSKSSSKRRRGR
jgi:putative FmdB family regulatory protein